MDAQADLGHRFAQMAHYLSRYGTSFSFHVITLLYLEYVTLCINAYIEKKVDGIAATHTSH